MLRTDTILRQVDLRLGELRPNYCLVMLIRAADGEQRIVLHEGSVGLDGQPCYHTGRYTEPNSAAQIGEQGADAAFEEALSFRRSVQWLDAPAHQTIPFTFDSPTSDATAHVYFTPNKGAKAPTAAGFLAPYIDVPGVAHAARLLAGAINTSGQWLVLKNRSIGNSNAILGHSAQEPEAAQPLVWPSLGLHRRAFSFLRRL